MSLTDIIHKKRYGELATAIPAIPAIGRVPPLHSVAKIAKLVVANPETSILDASSNSKNSGNSSSKLSGAKTEHLEVPSDCRGAGVDPESGAPYLPWGPYLTTDQLKAMQQAVKEVITELSRIEGWSDVHYETIAVEVGRQPICTLLPDLDYFRARVAAARVIRNALRFSLTSKLSSKHMKNPVLPT